MGVSFDRGPFGGHLGFMSTKHFGLKGNHKDHQPPFLGSPFGAHASTRAELQAQASPQRRCSGADAQKGKPALVLTNGCSLVQVAAFAVC